MMSKHRIQGCLCPGAWKSGPDPVDHLLYIQCQRARAQANYRGEGWTITEEEFIAMWRKDNLYLKRGKGPEDLCLTRKDEEKPWTMDNVYIIQRLEHYRYCNKKKVLNNRARKQREAEAKNVR